MFLFKNIVDIFFFYSLFVDFPRSQPAGNPLVTRNSLRHSLHFPRWQPAGNPQQLFFLRKGPTLNVFFCFCLASWESSVFAMFLILIQNEK